MITNDIHVGNDFNQFQKHLIVITTANKKCVLSNWLYCQFHSIIQVIQNYLLKNLRQVIIISLLFSFWIQTITLYGNCKEINGLKNEKAFIKAVREVIKYSFVF